MTEPSLADYLLIIDVDDLSDKRPRKLKSDLELYNTRGRRVFRRGLTLQDIDDRAAVSAEIGTRISELEGWLSEHR